MSMHRCLHLCQSLLLPVSMLAPSACGSDGVQLPGPGSIHVIATTTGTDLDLDGYFARVGGEGEEVPHLLLPNVALILNNMEEGMYMISLLDLSTNCTADVTQQQIPVSAGEVSEALFDVSCAELPAATVDVTGTWDGTYAGTDLVDSIARSGTIHFELVQSGDEVTGTVSTDGRLDYPVTGRVSGNSLELFHVGW